MHMRLRLKQVRYFLSIRCMYSPGTTGIPVTGSPSI